MKKRPILFSTPMVRAILDGRKTQTRRVVKDLPGNRGEPVGNHVLYWRPGEEDPERWCGCDGLGSLGWIKCPYGVPGDVLWVRETHYLWGHWVKNGRTASGRQKWRFVCDDKSKIAYFDTPPENVLTIKSHKIGWYKRPSIHMPFWACRLFLRVTDVRVERVQEISENDAKAEGIESTQNYRNAVAANPVRQGNARTGFCYLWDELNAKRGYGWEANPWVWVVSFEQIEKDAALQLIGEAAA